MIKSKRVGSVSPEIKGSVYSEKRGSISADEVGAVLPFFTLEKLNGLLEEKRKK